MMKLGSFLKTLRNERRYEVVVALVCIVVVGCVVLVLYRATLSDGQGIATEQPGSFYRQVPTRLQIPALALDTTFEVPLGLNPDNTVMVPKSYTEVGWYKNGVTPGDTGSAVILGHVDSKRGPGVFYSLGQLKVDDEILVTRADETTVTFVVTELKRYAQADFPTELVYGSDDQAVLRLVTCTGSFNRGEQRYSHNLVVFAVLK